ncbi:putative methyltransferase-domain-containing protein [Plectosphaerella plurivora]|uniref:Methyltransferase-domain-containing protein n=1 Tax=Plectosphaerella plurivora TaxID=936078 RepID=A0A9P9A8Y4_9PEZI|nr:putative methyltransferase-domain-containing protein [Plectosphaerella plurivora]
MALEPRDFPQMWQKPSSEEVLSTLQLLELKPPIWGHKRRLSEIAQDQEATAYFRREVATYLSSIVKSSLAWIEDDDEKDAVWSEASRRLSERCGRAAMGEITRRWPFREDDLSPTFELIIREPPLVGDSVGLKTWGSSYVLAQYLPRLGPTSLFRLFDESLGEPRPTVLELGSGTGLLGLAAAALWKVPVILSDLPEIMSNLHHNVEVNRDVIQALGGSLDSGALTWGGSSEDEVDQELFAKPNQFKVVLAADVLYDDVQPGLLASAFSDHLSHHDDSRAVVMVPLRDETAKRLRDSFTAIMAAQNLPLTCIEEGILTGEDDWGEQDEEDTVECWWGIFARVQPAGATA